MTLSPPPWPLLAAAALALAACDGISDPIACTAEVRPGVKIEAVSDVDDSPVIDGLAGELVDGDYEEELGVLSEQNLLFGATERPGTYLATVRATGFDDLEIPGIEVDADECHVITEERTARLTPS